ncbi:autophagy-related protein 2 [Elysia marginata]|uniref:Autophagy-related protein 2 n=1 Tax=Elysia marginata TaxID=1093978 RepID=A0AAV4I9Z3_9GAST|nr:autophagy-related protein 2 [Elysia marginata]
MLFSCGNVFPDAKIKACNFHVGQAWHKKLQQIGLAAGFQSNSETSTWLKSFFGLPALDPHEVEDCFAFVVMNNCPDSKSDLLCNFADYVFSYYISDSARDPPTLCLWASQDIAIRTTNASESFHNQFSKNFSSSHPNIFLFLEKLGDEQLRTNIKTRSAFQEHRVQARRHREREAAREAIISAHRKGEINQEEFLRRISFKSLPPKMRTTILSRHYFIIHYIFNQCNVQSRIKHKHYPAQNPTSTSTW